MSDLLVDSGVLILAIRGRPEALDAIGRAQTTGVPSISMISRAEVVARMHQHERDRTLGLLQAFLPLPITAAIADQAGSRIYAEASRGNTLSLPDALIGATASVHGLDLLTTNPGHFPMLEPARVIELLPLRTAPPRRKPGPARPRGRA